MTLGTSQRCFLTVSAERRWTPALSPATTYESHPSGAHHVLAVCPRPSRRCRRLRPAAATPRDPPQLPHPRALPLLARGGRARAAAVHRHQQLGGAAVQPRSAPLGVCIG